MQENPKNNERMWNNETFRADSKQNLTDVGGGQETENLFGVALS